MKMKTSDNVKKPRQKIPKKFVEDNKDLLALAGQIAEKAETSLIEKINKRKQFEQEQLKNEALKKRENKKKKKMILEYAKDKQREKNQKRKLAKKTRRADEPAKKVTFSSSKTYRYNKT